MRRNRQLDFFQIKKEESQGRGHDCCDLAVVFNYLMEEHSSNGARLFSEEHSGRTRGNRQVATWEITTSSKKRPFSFFGHEGGQTLEQVLRRVVGMVKT